MKRVLIVLVLLSLLVAFVSCSNKIKTQEDYTKSLTDKGYTVQAKPLSEARYKGCEFILSCTNAKTNDTVLIERFLTEDFAKEEYDKIKDSDKYESCEIDGLTIYAGTKQGVKDAK